MARFAKSLLPPDDLAQSTAPASAPDALTSAASSPAVQEVQGPETPLSPAVFREALAAWYKTSARKLPWRGVHDPYATWLSEIMLQQTRVATVIERYKEFLVRFPTLPALAAAREEDVLALWSGMGYYRRARMLLRGAQFVQRELRGKLPRTALELKTLPGIGDYTAAAIASIAFGECIAVIDGNVERVLMRVLGQPEDRSTKARAALATVAQSLVPPPPAATDKPKRITARYNPAGDHNQAMMELGATICLPRAPLCLQCPVLSQCLTRGEHLTPERAPLRSQTVAHLLALRKRGVRTEVLLERRSAAASLMPGMLELPPLPLEAIAALEPVLRLRHAITNTSYYVQVFATGVHGAALDPRAARFGAPLSFSLEPPQEALADTEDDTPEIFLEDPDAEAADQFAYRADPAELTALEAESSALLHAIAPAAELHWVDSVQLAAVPLTGLARKALQRLGVMAVPAVQLAAPSPARA